MESKKDIKRFLLAISVGGISAVACLFSLMALVAILSQDKLQVFEIALAVSSLAFFSLLTVWATGFWGQWGMIVFFILAPVVLVFDYAVDPIFPFGTIVFASACYGLYKGGRKNA